jgi:hypothetical protein
MSAIYHVRYKICIGKINSADYVVALAHASLHIPDIFLAQPVASQNTQGDFP